MALLLMLALGGCEAVVEHYGMWRSADCMMLRDNDARVEACTAVIRVGAHVEPVWLEDAYRNRALVHSSEGRHEEALADYLSWLELDEDNPIALLGASELLIDLARYDEADPLLARAVDRHNSFIARGLLASAALERGRYASAIEYYDMLLEREPWAEWLVGRAQAKACLGDAAGALADIEAAARLNEGPSELGEEVQCVQPG